MIAKTVRMQFVSAKSMVTGIVRSAIRFILTESDPMQDSWGEWVRVGNKFASFYK